MELKGKILEIREETEINGYKERIITIESDYKNQILDVFCYNNNSFLTGFLLINERIVFDIVLQGLEQEGNRETRIILKKIVTPQIKVSKDHPFVDCEWVRMDNTVRDKFERG